MSMQGDCKRKRMVDEYRRKEESDEYKLSRGNVEFSEYLRDNVYHIINIKPEHQLKYACNVLNLGNGTIVSVHNDTARQASLGKAELDEDTHTLNIYRNRETMTIT